MIFGDDKVIGDNNETLQILGDIRYDGPINYFFAVIIILAFIVSGVLNPALFWFHCTRPATVPALIFKMLNAIDFLTTTCLIPYLAYGLLTPTLMPHQVPASLGQRFYSAVFAFILFLSVSITTLMTAARVYAIKYPLKVMLKRYSVLFPMLGFISLALVIVGINFYYNTTWDRFLYSTNRLKLVLFEPGTGKINNWPELAFGGILMSIAVAGCVCAVITGKEVYKSISQMKLIGYKKKSTNCLERTHSCITIIMLAAGIQVAVVLVIVQFVYSIFVRHGFPYHANYFFYGNGLVCSLVTSVLNPIIKVARSSDFKKILFKELQNNFSKGRLTDSGSLAGRLFVQSQTLSA